MNLFEFQPGTFGPALIAIAIIAALQGRLVLLGATVLLTLGLKEDFSLTFLMLAVVLALLGKRRLGAVLAGVSLIWFSGRLTRARRPERLVRRVRSPFCGRPRRQRPRGARVGG